MTDNNRAASTVAQRLAEAHLTLPPLPPARANYVPFRRAASVVCLAGQGPAFADLAPSFGKLGAELTLEQGVDAARRTALSVLAVLKAACEGDFSRVKQCLQLTGYVNSAPGFIEQPAVIDGATQVLSVAFGESGLPARAAVAAPELPFNFAVEIQAVFELR